MGDDRDADDDDTKPKRRRRVPVVLDHDDPDRAIETSELADRLGLAEITVIQQRALGGGPPFFRVGRQIRYRLRDVDAWIAARTVGKRAS
jgi:predicted DNA-binding transcriptional regulator AlpA